VSELRTVAALYVDPRGQYPKMAGVDCWDEARDARLYEGPWPVVAHPPCERWGRYWHGGPSARERLELGDDGGCFEAALAAVRRWGGVLEHPAHSHAWKRFGLRAPRDFGWWWRDDAGGWTCHVEQGHYGHRARKATWLYAFGVARPELCWGSSGTRDRLDAGYHSAAERAAARDAGAVRRPPRLTKAECKQTPRAFAELLVAMARIAAATSAERVA
jgi:hypothetical protein